MNLKSILDTLDVETPEIDVSVGHIVTHLTDFLDTEKYYIGLPNVNRWNEGGQQQWQAVGGRPEIYQGLRDLLTELGAYKFRPLDGDPERIEARFRLPTENLIKALVAFAEPNNLLFEDSIERELSEEFVDKELQGVAPILTAKDMESIKPVYQKAVLQPRSTDSESVSIHVDAKIPTIRMFHLWELRPQKNNDVVAKIIAAPQIWHFTKAELATTNGGRNRGVTDSGDIIADNIGLMF